MLISINDKPSCSTKRLSTGFLALQILEKSLPVTTRDGDGATPLHFAASRGHLSVVKWLVFHGAKADEKDDGGRTPLDDAVENRHADVAELLSASAGATTASARRSVCALTDDEGRSPRCSFSNLGILISSKGRH